MRGQSFSDWGEFYLEEPKAQVSIYLVKNGFMYVDSLFKPVSLESSTWPSVRVAGK